MDERQPRRLDQLGVKHNRESIGTRPNSLLTMNLPSSRRDIHPTLMTQFRQESDSYEKGGDGVNPD
jgi:hypothetical protein